MFFEVHRLSVFTPRSLDVDVVLDLMIHDLDIVLSFANSPVKEVRAVGSAHSFRQSRHRQRAAGVRIGMRGQLHRQPGLHGAGAQAALLPAASNMFRWITPARKCWSSPSDRPILAPSTPTVNPQIGVGKPAGHFGRTSACGVAIVSKRCTDSDPPQSCRSTDGRRSLALALEIVSRDSRTRK